MRPQEHETDRQRYATERQLLIGGFAIVAIAGGAILWLRYGRTLAAIAVGLVLLGAGVLALLWLILTALDLWARSD